MTEDEIYLKYIKSEPYFSLFEVDDDEVKEAIMDTFHYKVFAAMERMKEAWQGIYDEYGHPVGSHLPEQKKKTKQPWKTKRKKKPWE